MSVPKGIWYGMNSNAHRVQNWNRLFARIERRAWAVRELNLSSHSSIFTSVSVDFSPRSYLFIFATVQIPVQTEPKCGTKPVRFVTLDFRDERDAASLRYRSLVEIKRERTPYPVWFRAGARAIRHTVNVPYDHRKLKTMALSFALRIPLWLT